MALPALRRPAAAGAPARAARVPALGERAPGGGPGATRPVRRSTRRLRAALRTAPGGWSVGRYRRPPARASRARRLGVDARAMRATFPGRAAPSATFRRLGV